MLHVSTAAMQSGAEAVGLVHTWRACCPVPWNRSKHPSLTRCGVCCCPTASAPLAVHHSLIAWCACSACMIMAATQQSTALQSASLLLLLRLLLLRSPRSGHPINTCPPWLPMCMHFWYMHARTVCSHVAIPSRTKFTSTGDLLRALLSCGSGELCPQAGLLNTDATCRGQRLLVGALQRRGSEESRAMSSWVILHGCLCHGPSTGTARPNSWRSLDTIESPLNA